MTSRNTADYRDWITGKKRKPDPFTKMVDELTPVKQTSKENKKIKNKVKKIVEKTRKKVLKTLKK